MSISAAIAENFDGVPHKFHSLHTAENSETAKANGMPRLGITHLGVCYDRLDRDSHSGHGARSGEDFTSNG